jgi:hypothetical protein
MPRFASLISVLALAAGLFFVSPTPAHADTRGYVSKSEFRRVHKGMKIKRVHRIFDTRGRQTAYYDGYKCGTKYGWCPEQDREYRTRSKWGYVDIGFKRVRGAWRLSSKHAYWG